MLTVKTIIETVYEKWAEAVSEYVGENRSMENSSIVSKLPAANCFFMGLPTAVSDLQGNEAGVTPTIQVDIFISSQWNISKAYEIDEASHTELKSMGFDRIYGPEIMQNISPSIKRLSSRYTRNVGYGDSL